MIATINWRQFLLFGLLLLLVSLANGEQGQGQRQGVGQGQVQGQGEVQRQVEGQGQRYSRKQLRIVGGQETTVFRHPYLVSLRYKQCPDCPFVHECGGIIYSSKMILTAAHCVYQRSTKSLYVVAGSDNRAGNDGIIMPIRNIQTHEQYNPATYENNIALLTLVMDLPMNPANILPIVLADRMPSVGSMAVVSGWGQLDEDNEDLPNKLHDVEVFIVRQSQCVQKYGQERIKASSLCAGVAEGGRDACTNDSGGPLLSDGKLVGIVSWSIGCARPESPGVYTNVVTLRRWIQQNAGAQKSKFLNEEYFQ